ncbi:hypothetical protein Dsin_020050 [Dipteronia sinensis]|uniref:Uncharacterized protein n=1 Tax=Dipteronia sinensis TaxID=43782 RepID=A0AAE0A953_9ROSI|nr:hypothetical protein Dsin_020050 [Dipteronia sinensis]
MASFAGASSTISSTNVQRLLPRSPKSLKFTNVIPVVTSRPVRVKQPPICCTKLTPWEPSPAKHAPALDAENTTEAPLASAKTEEVTAGASNQPLAELQFLKWPMWHLGPSLLLSTGMVLTELLTWHWQSPVWLVTPVVYKSYRMLQLMRGLKLGAELSAPAWMMHTIRGLV